MLYQREYSGPMIHKLYDKISMVLIWICGILICIVVGLVISNIVLRTVFSSPIKGTVEYVQYLVLFIAVMVLGRTCFEDKHIYVTILMQKIPEKARRIIYAVGRFICTAVLILMAYQMFLKVPETLKRVTETIKLPYYLIYVIMGVGMILAALSFALQGGFYLAGDKSKEEGKEDAK